MTKKKKKALPNNVSEDEFLKALDNVTKRLSIKFKFGYHSVEDIKQQAAIFALEGLEKYDRTRPLENFLWTHIRNRLFNFKRDNYNRPGIPCSTCPLYDPSNKQSSSGCLKYSNKNDCSLFYNWFTRNSMKKNIMMPAAIDDNDNVFPDTDTTNHANKQLLEIIDQKMPAQYRELYLKYRYGEKLSKIDKDKIINIIKDILNINE